ncbi:MAG: hypothetical protein SGBAC_007219 [Bacillariaceae sp.]
MQNNRDHRKIDGESSPKRHKSSSQQDLITQIQEQDCRSGLTSGQSQDVAVQERQGRLQSPDSDQDSEASPQGQAKEEGNDSQMWTAVKKDRNQRIWREQELQEQLSFFASEHARLSVTNSSLRYLYNHLKDAIKRIKRELGDNYQNPGVGASSSTGERIARFPSQQTITSNLYEQLSEITDIRRDMPQSMPLTAANLANISQLEASSLLSRGTKGRNSLDHASVPSGSGQTNFCCNEYMVYCALDPVIKGVYQGARHDPLCRNYPK